MLEELERNIFIHRVGERKFQRDSHHIQAKHAHPAGAVALLEVAAGGQRCAPVKYADVVQAQKATLEDILALRVLAVDPPGKVKEQLVEDTLQEHAICLTCLLLVNFVDAPGCPGGYRWVDVVKRPFKRRKLAAGMHVPLSQEQI